MNKYREIPKTEVPADLRFDVPRHNQGQIVEIAYADYPTDRYEACAGAAYKRITDRSDRSVTYYKRCSGEAQS